MSDRDESPDADLTAFENSLKSLSPSRSRINRDALMFRAGRESARWFRPGRSAPLVSPVLGLAGSDDPHRAFVRLSVVGDGKLRFWVATAASLAALALGEATLLTFRPSPRVVERTVVVHEPAPAPPVAVVSPPEPPTEESPPARPIRLDPGHTPQDRLAWQVLRYGLDGLPPSPVKSAWRDHNSNYESSRQLLRDELRSLLEPGDPS